LRSQVVINLEDSVAVTQNYVSRLELASVLQFMKHRPEQISGFKFDKVGGEGEADDDDDCGDEEQKRGLYSAFCAELQREKPDILREGLEGLDRLESARAGNGRGGGGQSVWDEVVGSTPRRGADLAAGAEESGPGSFEFGFAFEEADTE
jgi:hypothetical protein